MEHEHRQPVSCNKDLSLFKDEIYNLPAPQLFEFFINMAAFLRNQQEGELLRGPSSPHALLRVPRLFSVFTLGTVRLQ